MQVRPWAGSRNGSGPEQTQHLIDLGLAGGVESFEVDGLHFKARVAHDSINRFDHSGLRQFDGGERYVRRLEKVGELERMGSG